jgi:hypothetical protein
MSTALLRAEIIGKGVRFPHCPATVNGDESRNYATEQLETVEFPIGKARRVI